MSENQRTAFQSREYGIFTLDKSINNEICFTPLTKGTAACRKGGRACEVVDLLREVGNSY